MDTTERIPMTRREAHDLAAAGWGAYTLSEVFRSSRPAGGGGQDRARRPPVLHQASPVPPSGFLPSGTRCLVKSPDEMHRRTDRLVRWLRPAREY